MDKPILRELSKLIVENPTFIQGLPGFGNVGRIAANMLIKHSNAKLFAELYSPSFPDYVAVNSKGTCQLPCYEFYATKLDGNDYVIMTGETQPSFDDVLAHYEVCGEIASYAAKLGCRFMITMGGVPVTEEKAQVFIAATSPRLAAESMEKGAVIYSQGRIVGGTGLTLALAKELGLEGAVTMAGKQIDVRPFLWSSDVFVATNFGYIASLEAMAAGLAVVAPNFGILKETVIHGVNGLLFEPENADSLAESLIKLLKDEALRAEVASSGVASVQDYDIRAVAPRMGRIYQSVVKN